MSDLKYLDKKGTFTLDDPDLTSYMYFPLANEAGMMSAITPDLGGDIKLDQNTFLLEPVSSENLHNNKSSRNFWVYVEGKGAWSVTGRSSKQQAKLFEDDKEDVKLTAGIMWHQVERQSQEMGLKAVMTSFVPETEEKVELTSPSEFKAGSKVVLNGQKMKKLHEGMEIKRTLNHPMIERIDEGLKQKKKENLKGKIIIQKDQCAKLILKDGENHVEVIGPVIEEAKKNGAMPADIEKLLKKTGQTHYTFEELEVDLGENLFVPGSVLKKLRKEAFAQMDQTKILKYRRTYEDPVKENDVASSQEQEDGKIQIAVSMENLEYLDIVTEDREVMKIYLSWMELKQQEDPQAILNKIKTAGKQCYLMLPQIARKRQMEELKAKKDLIFTNEIDGLLVRNLEEFSWLIEEGYQKEMIADYMFYGYNKEAVKEYQRLSGIQIRMTYPSELNKKEMEQLELLNADLFLYGYQPLMVSAQCVKNNLRGCDKIPSWLTLKDRYNANFFVHTSCCDCINEIYNGKPLWVGNEAGILNDLHPSVIRFHITRENEVQVKEILNAAKSIQKGERASLATEYTTGHLKREVL